MVNGFEVAEFGLAQELLEVKTTDTPSPLIKLVVENVLLFDPTSVPFTFHWYVGLTPPFVAVAVNVTWVPAHIVKSASLEEMLTDGASVEFTVMRRVTVVEQPPLETM